MALGSVGCYAFFEDCIASLPQRRYLPPAEHVHLPGYSGQSNAMCEHPQLSGSINWFPEGNFDSMQVCLRVGRVTSLRVIH